MFYVCLAFAACVRRAQKHCQNFHIKTRVLGGRPLLCTQAVFLSFFSRTFMPGNRSVLSVALLCTPHLVFCLLGLKEWVSLCTPNKHTHTKLTTKDDTHAVLNLCKHIIAWISIMTWPARRNARRNVRRGKNCGNGGIHILSTTTKNRRSNKMDGSMVLNHVI